MSKWNLVTKRTHELRIQLRSLVESTLKARTLQEAKLLYEKGKDLLKQMAVVWAEDYCNELQKYFNSLGLYGTHFRCKYCPHRRHLEVEERKMYFEAKTAKTLKEFKQKMKNFLNYLVFEEERYQKLHHDMEPYQPQQG
jgi:hypothetical protein